MRKKRLRVMLIDGQPSRCWSNRRLSLDAAGHKPILAECTLPKDHGALNLPGVAVVHHDAVYGLSWEEGQK